MTNGTLHFFQTDILVFSEDFDLQAIPMKYIFQALLEERSIYQIGPYQSTAVVQSDARHRQGPELVCIAGSMDHIDYLATIADKWILCTTQSVR